MDKTYEQLLEQAYKQVPTVAFDRSRFNIPEPELIHVGNKTVLMNFRSVCLAMNRAEKHFMKYLLRELGASGNQSGEQLIVQGKFTVQALKERIDAYLKEFVFCRECKRPDTKIVKYERILFLQCEACGARTVLRGL